MYQGFFEISLQLQEFLSLPFQLISSLCHQNKLQFVFRQELSLWSKKYSWIWPVSYSDGPKKVPLKWTLYSQFYNWLHKDIAAAQRVAHLTDQWHFVCRSFCNWHSIAFWIQVPASLLLPAQSTVKDIKDPSGNYSLPGFKECKQIMLHNYTGHVGLTKHNITQKIIHVFHDIHYLRWTTEVNLPQRRTD